MHPQDQLVTPGTAKQAQQSSSTLRTPPASSKDMNPSVTSDAPA